MIEILISSKTRIKLLLKFFLNSSNNGYLRGLESEFGESTNAIRLELNKFENAGLLVSKKEGNKKYFRANITHPLFSDINNILLKFTGLDSVVEKVIAKLGDVKLVYLLGDLANGLSSDVIDLVFVGNMDKKYLFSLIQKTQKSLGKKIKYLTFKSSEMDENKLSQMHDNYLLLWSK